MTFLSSLDAKDRRLLLWCVGIGLALAVATGFLLPNSDNDNPLPSTVIWPPSPPRARSMGWAASRT